MARICELCGKRGQFGSAISHSKTRSKRRFKVNLQTAAVDGKKKRICTSCLKKRRKTHKG
ncbi:MAG TPA: 50S ribosomal protein L28 [candidate division WWE3 bacterium]|uniref:Large ribosomal subunit protein bL28 n=1 Tax=candidate division WWE3 bacterium TaxID=2053526 RepID=A0A7C1T2S7_UNCKA|nr:50S ribosomal protein L28 [candidate division WWE3 bacterium]